MTPTVNEFLKTLEDVLGTELDPEDMTETLAKLGSFSRMFGATLRNTANPTMLNAGYKVNVIPGDAEAHVDGRFLPGYEEEFFATIDELLGDKVQRETVIEDIALETGFDGRLVETMKACLAAEDPLSRTAPLLMSGGTDAKSWSRPVFGALVSCRCSCRRIWISWACSTASTSGCRRRRWSSGRGCWTASSTRPDSRYYGPPAAGG